MTGLDVAGASLRRAATAAPRGR
ncbi:hypothetical protein [Nonomuraea dietziae]